MVAALFLAARRQTDHRAMGARLALEAAVGTGWTESGATEQPCKHDESTTLAVAAGTRHQRGGHGRHGLGIRIFPNAIKDAVEDIPGLRGKEDRRPASHWHQQRRRTAGSTAGHPRGRTESIPKLTKKAIPNSVPMQLSTWPARGRALSDI